ncbi:group II intron maturase-specific domain-containing protein, partial [Acinetobacter baumannii]|uniref:group II intron maturase-specific domain-containing protein n=1 Tax=Acinetobacter baumannii TaxID=470 RepID=UPI00339DA35F
MKQEELIRLLNPILRGWALYHQPVVAKKAYSRMDHQIFQALWRWAKRRHPNKSLDWVREKYFQTYENRSWVFATTVITESGGKEAIRLYALEATPIERHRKISGDFNPFDPSMEEMGEALRMSR